MREALLGRIQILLIYAKALACLQVERKGQILVRHEIPAFAAQSLAVDVQVRDPF